MTDHLYGDEMMRGLTTRERIDWIVARSSRLTTRYQQMVPTTDSSMHHGRQATVHDHQLSWGTATAIMRGGTPQPLEALKMSQPITKPWRLNGTL